MKRKHSSISLILGLSIIGMCVFLLIGGSTSVVIPVMLTALGLYQIFNGVHFYKLDRKSDGILLISAGIFIFIAVLKITLF